MTTDYAKYKTAMNETKTIRQLDSLLKKEGFTFIRQNGSHGTYKNTSGKTVTVKMNEVTRGTLRNVLQLVFVNWNVKPQETQEVELPVENSYDLTNEQKELCKELGLLESELTLEDYNTIVELTNG